jgi:hypothetical protein
MEPNIGAAGLELHAGDGALGFVLELEIFGLLELEGVGDDVLLRTAPL